MSTFTYLPDAAIESSITYKTLVTDTEYGKKRRRNKQASPKRSWNLNFMNTTETIANGITAFYISVSGPFETFDWENPVDSVTYTVRFKDGSFNKDATGIDNYNIQLSLVEVI